MAAIFIRTIIIYLALTVSLKVMGKRQIGELEVSELVSTLVVSEVAALPIADPDIPLLNAVIPTVLIVCLEIIISTLKNKSEKLKKCIEGEPIFLIHRGVLQQDALKKNRISVNELLCEIRMQGVGDISEVYYAVLEQNGKVSVFEKNSDKNFSHPVVIDKETDEKTLHSLGYNGKWLENQLKKHRIKQKDVFLMTVDDDGNTSVIKRTVNNEDN